MHVIYQDKMENVVKHVRFAMGITAMGVGCGAVEWVKKHGALRWFGHVSRINEGYLLMRLY